MQQKLNEFVDVFRVDRWLPSDQLPQPLQIKFVCYSCFLPRTFQVCLRLAQQLRQFAAIRRAALRVNNLASFVQKNVKTRWR